MSNDAESEDTPKSQDQTPAAPEPPVDPRPKPAYGEYAPEGWEWKPESDDASAASTTHPQGSDPSHSSVPTGASTTPSGAGRIPGVPHNLGISGSSVSGSAASAPPAASTSPSAAPTVPQSPSGQHPESASASSTREPGDPYRAAPPGSRDGHTAAQRPAPPAAQFSATGAPVKDRKVDRVFTIILLALGALGALSMADSLFRIDAQFMLLSEMFGMESITVPGWVNTMCLIGAVGVLAIYALNLIYSVQRMRARKLTFWVPLVAGAIAWLIVSVLTGIALTSSPELMERLSDPNALNEMLQYMSETSAP